jgi:hypothetical protein
MDPRGSQDPPGCACLPHRHIQSEKDLTVENRHIIFLENRYKIFYLDWNNLKYLRKNSVVYKKFIRFD